MSTTTDKFDAQTLTYTMSNGNRFDLKELSLIRHRKEQNDFALVFTDPAEVRYVDFFTGMEIIQLWPYVIMHSHERE